MANIHSLQDAWDYLRLCDGGKDYSSAVAMITEEYNGMRERYDALRASFATEVENAFNRKLDDKDREITQLHESLELAHYQRNKAREALYAHPEDEDDS